MDTPAYDRVAWTKLVPQSWDDLYDKHFRLASDGVRDGDLELLTAMRVHDRLYEVDFAAALKTESLAAATTTVDIIGQLRELAEKVREFNDDTKTACEGVQQAMGRLSLLGHSQIGAGWQKTLNEESKTLRARAVEGMECLRDWGKRKIEDLPPQVRPLTARVFTGALQSVLGFLTKALRWLGEAGHSTIGWVRNASESVERWRESVIGWFLVARKEIDEWFVASGVSLKQRRILSRMCTFSDWGDLGLKGTSGTGGFGRETAALNAVEDE